jgi:Lrp/AsnC family transcriptional regulator, leucine-responsive regulatory protein
LFAKRREKAQVTLQTESSLDATDWKILRELQQDARLSYNELGRRVALSAPAAAERVRKLEDKGVITRYSAQIDPSKVGLPILAFIQMRCEPGKCLRKDSSARDFPEVLEMHTLSSTHCSLLKVAVASMKHLTALNERLENYGSFSVNIVTATALTNRPIDWENPDVGTEPCCNSGWMP